MLSNSYKLHELPSTKRKKILKKSAVLCATYTCLYGCVLWSAVQLYMQRYNSIVIVTSHYKIKKQISRKNLFIHVFVRKKFCMMGIRAVKEYNDKITNYLEEI